MKKSRLLVAGVACLVVLLFNSAQANVLTFDDLAPTSNNSHIPNGYGGLNWGNMYYLNASAYPNSGYSNGLVSGDYLAFNLGANLAVASGSSFDFNGAYLVSAWNDGLSVNIKGYLGASLLYDTTVNPSYESPTWFQFNFLGVDKLEFTSFGGVDADIGDDGMGFHFGMDNFTYNAVPIPAGIWLFSSGLLSFIGLARGMT